MNQPTTREEAQALMPKEMTKAFETGFLDRLAGESVSKNPYGGLPEEVGTTAYPAHVPVHLRKCVSWLRAEWFWGHETTQSPNPRPTTPWFTVKDLPEVVPPEKALASTVPVLFYYEGTGHMCTGYIYGGSGGRWLSYICSATPERHHKVFETAFPHLAPRGFTYLNKVVEAVHFAHGDANPLTP